MHKLWKSDKKKIEKFRQVNKTVVLYIRGYNKFHQSYLISIYIMVKAEALRGFQNRTL